MGFTSVVAGSALQTNSSNFLDSWAGATPDDVFVVTLRNSEQFKITGFTDLYNQNFDVGRPGNAADYVNFHANFIADLGSFTIAQMDGTPAYTWTNTSGSYKLGDFRITFDGSNLVVEQDAGDDAGIFTSKGNYQYGFNQIETLYSGPICFRPGTMIATPAGECAVESLRIGDLVTTASGERKTVKWMGHMSLKVTRFNRAVAVPIRIRQGALGNGLPVRDLYVSGDHAIAVDGLLVNAGVLVNGETIVRCDDYAGAAIEYFQIELEDHDLVLAEGAAAETFLEDGDNRAKFDNAAAFAALYPDHLPCPPMPMGRVTSARQLPKSLGEKLSGRKTA